ncbi:hypothetical protein B0H19DRAFT_140578 [Mycena capillaripes]|nr:hypothetical protein B0H19DRAFT_140578 [Mycena capillaripes]
MAKFFPRGVDPYFDIGLVMFYGSEARWAVPVSSDPSNTIVTPPKEQAVARAHIDAFEKMVAIFPDSIDVLREFYKDDAQWGRLVSKFREASKSARQHDRSGLKGKTKYLLSDPTKAIVPALSDVDSKSDRGINHPVLRDAIIPWPLRLQIHAKDKNGELTEDATAALKALLHGCKTTDGEPALTHKKFPSCFYADGTYDPQNIDNGLFRSQFLLRVRSCSFPAV